MAGPTSRITRVNVEGPLGPFVDAFTARLRASGYTALSIVNELRQVAHLSRWLMTKELAASDVSVARLEEFLVERRERSGHKACSLQSLLLFRAVMVAAGAVTESGETVRPLLPVEVLLGRFLRYLLAERGLSSGTAEAYVARARRFVARCCVDGDVRALTAADVTGAVRAEAARVSVGSTQYFVAGVRSFLRFCFIDGLIAVDLADAALAVTGRRGSSLPRGISDKDAAALLASCDRRRSDGRRDYAILLVLLRLGLRAGEVARLSLDDIDWRAGDIAVHGKGRRLDRLPLPTDVGAAIVGYLKRGRPDLTDERAVFLRRLAPIGPLGRGGVACVVRRACHRAGLPEIGPHRLRHTLACQMVTAGVGLSGIGQVLRHQGVTTTAIYARVDIAALTEVARPWPTRGAA